MTVFQQIIHIEIQFMRFLAKQQQLLDSYPINIHLCLILTQANIIQENLPIFHILAIKDKPKN